VQVGGQEVYNIRVEVWYILGLLLAELVFFTPIQIEIQWKTPIFAIDLQGI
jgi:hypothetical protein